ncbi:SAM-dependent methyltransferase [Hyalangium rubrum]|uniref:Methyltransferase domain-containing protein n=1 Tax=Hyalangium rubrum TaxID=3103134 RepID=A0ABU5GZ09_9BACT|nr:methyltransferase domain-containing protein [Hyalangium sp. s54d21]MDY7226430.1 methyltransferase domain-containing protein [Hyalangium sp. s54d21]
MSAQPLRAPPRDEVSAYYDAKTERLLHRYGPGPRVHYHTGMVEEIPPPGLTVEALRVRIHEAQERLLKEMALAVGGWQVGREVLDVGCGLGGGSLYWAAEHKARVTAITIAPAHLPWVRRFAEQAGVAHQVTALLCDALEVPGRECFDLVVAVESSCYLPRREWFRKLRTLLRPGGRVLLTDCFLGRPAMAAPFDRYWRTRIGAVDEYFRAASEEGLRLELHQDLTWRAVNFWTLTLDLLAREREAKLRQGGLGLVGRSQSEREHLRLQQGFLDGGLHHGWMVLRRPR